MRSRLKKLFYENFLCTALYTKVSAYKHGLQVPLSKRPKIAENHRFVIVIPAYNAKAFYIKNLTSVLEQEYSRFRVIYIDDCSTDGTSEFVENYIKSFPPACSFELRTNGCNKGALANLYEAIWSCENDEIIITLDGDDWLAHNRVLQILNDAYSSKETWLTYGQYITYPMYHRGHCSPIPETVLTGKSNTPLRAHPWVTSHLRTFYTALFKKIRSEDLLWEGEYARVSWDIAMMLPMLEIAQERVQFIPDILHIYNDDHPLNDHHVRFKQQQQAEIYFRSLPSYPRASMLFEEATL